MDPRIFYDRQPREIDQLRGMSSEKISSLIIALFNLLEGHTDIDDEVLVRAGYFVATFGHLEVDKIVLNWLEMSPTERHLLEAGAFLHDYWRTVHVVPDLLQINRLIHVLNGFIPQDAGWRYATAALLETYKRSDLPSQTQDHLRSTLKQLSQALAKTSSIHPPLLGRLVHTLGIHAPIRSWVKLIAQKIPDAVADTVDLFKDDLRGMFSSLLVWLIFTGFIIYVVAALRIPERLQLLLN